MSVSTISRRSFLAASAGFGLVLGSTGTSAAQAAFPLVVDLPWLEQAAEEPGLRLLDVAPLHIWRRGHIDAARHAWWRDTIDPNYPVYGALLPPGSDQADRQRMLDSLAITNESRIVVYDNTNRAQAARMVWFLRFLGLSRTTLLNASFADWQRAPFPVPSSAIAGPAPAANPQEGFYLVTEQVVDLLSTPDVQLIDIRSDDERSDEMGGTMPVGQIPGSIRLPWPTLLDADGHLQTAERTSELLASRGIDPNSLTVLYGRYGVDTALSWVALRNAGLPNLRSYDRGWAEWSTMPDLPRAPIQ